MLLVPDLHARVTLFDKDNKVIAHLGYDPEWTKKVLDGFKMRGQPEQLGSRPSSSTRTTPASTRTATSSSSSGCRPGASTKLRHLS